MPIIIPSNGLLSQCRLSTRGMQKPGWAELLEQKGVYYEGIVNDPDRLVEKLTADTVTTFGTRRSRQIQSPQGKENQTEVRCICS